MTKVGIIGGGASGVFAAIRIKENHPEWEVSIFEHTEKLLKKIYATGNGRCNFANSSSIKGAYNEEEFVKNILESFDHIKIKEYFESIGIAIRKIDDLYYPYSLSAATVCEKLIEKLQSLKIKVHLNCEVLGYSFAKGIYLLNTNEKEYQFDKLIFACGGKSSPQLGTKGSLFSILDKHGYKISKLTPSLCPIKVKENVNKIDGVRAKAKVSLFSKNNKVYEEEGEVQFRKDAISGVVNFNMAFAINKFKLQTNDITFHIDFVPDCKNQIKKEDYSNYLTAKLAKYLIDNNLDIHDSKFTFKSFYDFDSSQVTSGGVCLENITDNLESKIEKNVYFIGEVLDVDAKCGGYNLMWAFVSAERIAR